MYLFISCYTRNRMHSPIIKKFNNLLCTHTRDLPACSIAPQPSTLPRAPSWHYGVSKYLLPLPGIELRLFSQYRVIDRLFSPGTSRLPAQSNTTEWSRRSLIIFNLGTGWNWVARYKTECGRSLSAWLLSCSLDGGEMTLPTQSH
jgi:hypothetical protein